MRVKMFSLILFFALLLALSTYAQEPTEPPPTVAEPTIPPITETLIPPSPTPSDLPIATETSVPSLTPTATDTGIPILTETPLTTATSDITLNPTGSSAFTTTPTPSLTASLQPTFDPFATLEAPFTTQIFDNFDSGALGIWQIGSGWSLVPSEGGQALQAQNTAEPVVMDDDTLYNASIQVRILMNTGAIRLFLRQSEMGEYSATLDADGFINVYRETELLGSAQVTASLPGQWRTFRFSTVEDVLRVWVDDLEIGSLSDPSPLQPGRVGFDADAEQLTVDDVVVAWEAFLFSSMELLDDPTPTPTSTPQLAFSYDFRTAPLSGITILPESYAPLTGLKGEYVPGEGYRYIKESQGSGGRWYSAINLRIDFFEPLPLETFLLSTEAIGGHSLTLYATDGTSYNVSHADGWYRSIGWTTSSNGNLLTRSFTHAIYQGDWNKANDPSWALSYVRDLSLTLREQATPFPTWGETGIVQIQFAQAIPPLQDSYTSCVRTTSVGSRGPCAILAFNEYLDFMDGSMSWGEFISLVAYAEGHTLLLGDSLGNFQNPQASELGVCWRRATGTWLQGADQCNVSTSATAPGVQNDFVYAILEWLLKECAIATGFTDSNGYPDYEKGGIYYAGECNEAGLYAFLGQVSRLYADTTFSFDANLYFPRMSLEFQQWGWHEGVPQRYRYGVCPCAWGNVATEGVARTNPFPSINNGFSFSYFLWDADDAPDADNRYFRVN